MRAISFRRWFSIAVVLATTASSGSADENYLKDVKLVLKNKCLACHGALKQEAGLRLDTAANLRKGGDSGPAIIPGKERESLLIERITADESERMPPDGAPLTALQVKRIKEWIRQGARAPANEASQQDPKEHWAFQPLKKIGTPFPVGANPIDVMIRRRLEKQDLKPAPAATRHDLLRRLFLDMHGLPPTPEQLDSFIADRQPDAYRKWVNHVLDSPRYGERWAQHWLDVIRYADTHGFEVNTPRPNAWPYRDYVIRSFNDDKPYDQFVREQIAGDTLGADAATGFLVAAAALLPGQIGKDEPSKRKARQDALDEMIVGTSATLLGLTIGCARCHDHKFDPITQRDYYAMQAFFAGVDYGDRPINDPDAQQKKQKARQLLPRIEQLKSQQFQFLPVASSGSMVLIDGGGARTRVLTSKKPDVVKYATGTTRGSSGDVGSSDRQPHLGDGQYLRWPNQPGRPLISYSAGRKGRFRVWVSWGVQANSGNTRDALFVLDHDGNLETTDDQQLIAKVDQTRFADNAKPTAGQRPRWSGLADCGIHQLTSSSLLFVRSGKTGKWTGPDACLFEEVSESATAKSRRPRMRAPVSPLKNVERIKPTCARYVRFTSLQTIDDDRHEPCLDELEVYSAGPDSRNLASAKSGASVKSSGNYPESRQHQLKHINDGKYGNDFSWISSEKGKGWVQIELASPALIDRIVWSRDRTGKFRDRLATRYRIELALKPGEWTIAARSDDRLPLGSPYDESLHLLRSQPNGTIETIKTLASQLKALEAEKKELEKNRLVFGGVFREPVQTFVLHRGDPEQKKEMILPAVPQLFATEPMPAGATDTERRIALAKWITHPGNPLTARVIANRVWQYHFGSGLVDTPSDFGLNAKAPTHPQLLDWLATELIEHDWSLKHLHRIILLSNTYRQSNQIDAKAQSIDQDCRLLWRFPTRRLEAEAIRDSMLQVSGELNLKMGGPGFDFFKSRGGLSGFPAYETFQPKQLRRTIYAHKIRMEPIPVFGAFDCPDAGRAMPRRNQSTTAIQALNLLNSTFVLDRARAFANRIRSVSKTDGEQVDIAFRMALGRRPTEKERVASLATVAEHGLMTLCRVLLISNEFLYFP